MAFEAKHVLNGTHGALWLNGSLVSEAIGCEASVELVTEEVPQSGKLQSGKKVVGRNGKGKLTLHKVTSRMIKAMSEDMKNNRQTEFTLISAVTDPDAYGSERVQLIGLIFDKLPLIGWNLKELLKEELEFEFADWDVIDTIDESNLGG